MDRTFKGVDGWVGTQSVTRQLFLRPDGTIGSRPIRQLDSLHISPPATVHATKVTDGTTMSLTHGDALDVNATIDVARSTATSFTLRLRASKAEGAELRYDLATHTLTLDTTRAGYAAGGTWSATAAPDDHGKLHLRVLIDRSTAEVFTGDGTALSARLYPRYHESDQVELSASGGVLDVTRAQSWRMGSSWSPQDQGAQAPAELSSRPR
ncbi:MAG: hypothetical protein JWN52_289 [Actinomycetia bacterium]|nr:hypothetical protein [Actinomycetes bacterium]